MLDRLQSLECLPWADCHEPASRFHATDWVQWPSGGRRYVHRWSLADTSHGGICIIHGLGEHAGRYAELAGFLAGHGYLVTAHDLPGHGHDSGRRGVVPSYQALLADVGDALAWTSAAVPGSPVFLLGHSMGGNLIVNYLLHGGQPPLAAIASSPMFLSPREPRGLANLAARLLLRWAPNLCIGTGVRYQWLTDDPAEQALVAHDPLYHRRVSLRLGAALIDSGRWAIEHAARLPIPLLVTHGTEDRLTLPAGSAQFAQRAGERCRFELLAGHRHESFRDLERRAVWQLFLDFLESFQPGNTEQKDRP